MNTGPNRKQPASAGTLGEKEHWLAQHTSFNTLDNWGHKTPTQWKKRKDKKEMVKGSWPGTHTIFNTLSYISIIIFNEN